MVTNVSTVNQIPALVGKLGFEPKWGQIEFAGLYRRLRAQGDDYNTSLNGWGLMLDGYIRVFDKDNLIIGILYGEALGSYINDTRGFGLDAVPSSAINPDLRVIPALGAWVGYQHWWNRALRSTTTYGYITLDNAFDQTPNPMGTFQSSQYASANLIWSPLSAIDLGLEYLYGWRKVTANTAINGRRTGDNHRIQASIQWHFYAQH